MRNWKFGRRFLNRLAHYLKDPFSPREVMEAKVLRAERLEIFSHLCGHPDQREPAIVLTGDYFGPIIQINDCHGERQVTVHSHPLGYGIQLNVFGRNMGLVGCINVEPDGEIWAYLSPIGGSGREVEIQKALDPQDRFKRKGSKNGSRN